MLPMLTCSRSFNRSAPVLALALLLPATTLAQASESSSAPPVDPETILVTGKGLADPPAVAAYDSQTIERAQIVTSASGRIEDVLSQVAGFQQFRRSDSRSANPSAQGATLRALGGNATSRALVLLDGVPMADPFFGYVPFSALVPDRIGMIRVTRGGGSGPFGAGALAGTIELSSAVADTLDTLSASALVNDRGESEIDASIAGNLGRGSVAISGRWDRGGGFHTAPRNQRVAATSRAAFDSWSAQIRAVAPLGDTIELQARGLVYADERTLRFNGADSMSDGQDASLRLVGRGRWQFDVLAYVQARNFSNVVISSTRFVPVLDQRNTPSTGMGGKFELRPPLGNDHVLRLGADYRRADGELFETAISAVTGRVTERRQAGGTNTDLGLFVEHDWSRGPLTLTAGSRADRFTIREGFYRAIGPTGAILADDSFADRAGWTASLRGGAAIKLGTAAQLRAAAYSGLRLPTLNELYRPFVVFPVTTRANAGLANERLEGYEAGLDVDFGEEAKLSLTVFDNKVKNAIANVTIGTNLRQRQNIDAIHARGIEASGRVRLGRLGVDASLAYADAEARGSGIAAALNGNRPAQTPRWSGSATLSYRSEGGAAAAATLRHVGAQFEDDLESDILPAATTLDAYVEVPLIRKLSLVVRGENLTDETIVTRNQGGSLDLGVPRTIWAGIKAKL